LKYFCRLLKKIQKENISIYIHISCKEKNVEEGILKNVGQRNKYDYTAHFLYT